MAEDAISQNNLASSLMRHVLPKLTTTTQIPEGDWAGWDDLLLEFRINKHENAALAAEVVGRAQHILARVLESTLHNANMGSEGDGSQPDGTLGAESQLAGLQLSQLLGSAAEDQVVLEQPTARITNKAKQGRSGRQEVLYEVTFDGYADSQAQWYSASKIRSQYANGEALIQAYEAQQAALAGGAEPQTADDTSAQAASAAAAAAATMLPQVQPLQTAPPVVTDAAAMPTDAMGIQRLLEASGAVVTSTGMVMMPGGVPLGAYAAAEGGADGAGTSAGGAAPDQAAMLEMLQRHLGANAGKRPRDERPDSELTPEEQRQRKLAKQYQGADAGAAAGADQNAAAAAAAAAASSMGYDAATLLPQLPIFVNNQQGGLSMPMAPGGDAAAAAAAGDADQHQQQQQQQGVPVHLQVPPLPSDPRERIVRRCYDGIKWLLHNSDELARKKRQQARRAELNQRRALNLAAANAANAAGGQQQQQLLPAASGSSADGLAAPGMSGGGHVPDHKALLVASLRRNLLPLVAPPMLALPAAEDGSGQPEDENGGASASASAALVAPAPLASLQPSSSPYWALPAPGRQLAAGGNATPAIAELRNALPSLMPPSSAPLGPAAGVVTTAMPGGLPEIASLRQSLTGLVGGAGVGGEALPGGVDAAAAAAAAVDAAMAAGVAGVAGEGDAAGAAEGADGSGAVAAPEGQAAGAAAGGGGRGGGRGGRGGRGGKRGDDEAMIAAMSLTRMSRLDSDGEEAPAEGAAAAVGVDGAAVAGVEGAEGGAVATPDGAAVAGDEEAQRWAAASAPAPTVQQLLGDSGQPGGPSVNDQVEALVRAAAFGNSFASQGATSAQRAPRSDGQRHGSRGIHRLPTSVTLEPGPTATSSADQAQQPMMGAVGGGAGSAHADMAAALGGVIGGVIGGSSLQQQYVLHAAHQQQMAQMAAQQQLMNAHYVAQQQLAAAAGLPAGQHHMDATFAGMSDAERANLFARFPHLATQNWMQQQQRQEHGESPQGGNGAVPQQDGMAGGVRGSEALQQQQGMEAAMPMMPMYVLPPHLRGLQGAVDAFPDVVQHSLADYAYMGGQSLEQQQQAALQQQLLAQQQHAQQQQVMQHHLQQLDPRGAAAGMRRNSQGTQQQQDMAGMMAGSGLAFYTQQPSQPAL